MHTNSHPNAGKMYRVHLGGNLQAGYDLSINKKLFTLIDWADRIELNTHFPKRHKEVAVLFYAHRCEPDLDVSDPVPLSILKLSDVVYGTYVHTYRDTKHDRLVLLRESELIDP